MCLPVKPFRVEREWEHAGFKCAVTQPREAGSRCGYVRVPPGHWAFGANYNDVDVDVHGGLSFAAPEPCEHEDGAGYWLGFDCGHAGDAIYDPSVKVEDCTTPTGRYQVEIRDKYIGNSALFGLDGHYWTQGEVERECERLANQLRKRKK